MTNSPEIFKATDKFGKCNQYTKGAIVYKNGEAYIATRDPVLCLSPEHKGSGWEPLSSERTGITVTYFSGSTPPSRVVPGDEWFNSNTGKLYKYISDADSEQWVQIY
jgi:hypothetical protein